MHAMCVAQLDCDFNWFLWCSNNTVWHFSVDLQALCTRVGGKLSPAFLSKAIEEAATLVDDKDLPLTAHSLSMFCVILHSQPATASYVAEKVLSLMSVINVLATIRIRF